MRLLFLWLCGLIFILTLMFIECTRRARARIARALSVSEAKWDAQATAAIDDGTVIMEWSIADRPMRVPHTIYEENDPLSVLASDGWWYGD